MKSKKLERIKNSLFENWITKSRGSFADLNLFRLAKGAKQHFLSGPIWEHLAMQSWCFEWTIFNTKIFLVCRVEAEHKKLFKEKVDERFLLKCRSITKVSEKCIKMAQNDKLELSNMIILELLLLQRIKKLLSFSFFLNCASLYCHLLNLHFTLFASRHFFSVHLWSEIIFSQQQLTIFLFLCRSEKRRSI